MRGHQRPRRHPGMQCSIRSEQAVGMGYPTGCVTLCAQDLWVQLDHGRYVLKGREEDRMPALPILFGLH